MPFQEQDNPLQVLLVDDEARALAVYSELLADEGYPVVTASSGEEARREAGNGHGRIGLVILDLRLPDVEGLELFRWFKERFPGLPVIILTAYGSVESAVQAVREGAFHYLTKPPELEQLNSLVQAVMERRALEEENAALRRQLRSLDGRGRLIGRSRAMLDVYQWIKVVGPSQVAALVRGESGTGKELAARALHRHSPRKEGPFVSVNCGALPPNLLESELFGHEKGAFTGAVSSKPGLFELADGGTIFLDELGECSPELQVRLLRVLQDKEVRRIGGLKGRRSDFRMIAASNAPLEDEVAAGRFREDLYYRVNVISLVMPPLRERKDDIPLLTSFFMERFMGREGKPLKGVEEEALALLAAHGWPGNVRELENAVEHAVVVAEGPRLQSGDFPPALRRDSAAGTPGGDLIDGDRPLSEVERAVLEATLARHDGNKSRAARVLGISRKLLYSKIREYNL